MPSRRSFLATFGTAGSAALAGCNSVPFVGGRTVPLGDDYPARSVTGVDAGWPRCRRDGANTACAPDAESVTDPSVQWRSPRLSMPHRWQDNRTVTADGGAVYAGGESLQAFGSLSGDRLWTQPASRETWYGPTLYDSLAWAPAADGDGVVLGVNPSTGDVAERLALPGDVEVPPSVTAEDGYFVSPTDAGIVAAMRDPPDAPGLFEPEWTQHLFAGGYRVATTESVFAVSYAGEVYRMLPRGRPYWRTDLNRLVASGPVVGDRRVYVATEGGAVALLADDGRRVWEYDAPADTFDRGVAFDGARVFLTGESALHAVSAKTGERVWEARFEEPVTAAPSVGGDRVYVGTGDTVRALTVGGEEAWSVTVDGGVGGMLALAAGRIYTIVNGGETGQSRVVALA